MNSPCVKLCEYDSAAGLCRGCGRTLDEIADWPVMGEEAQARVLAKLPERFKTLQAS